MKMTSTWRDASVNEGIVNVRMYMIHHMCTDPPDVRILDDLSLGHSEGHGHDHHAQAGGGENLLIEESFSSDCNHRVREK